MRRDAAAGHLAATGVTVQATPRGADESLPISPRHLRKGPSMHSDETVLEDEVSIDRRAQCERRQGDRRKKQVPVLVDRRSGSERRQGERRRQVDPTTCERDYTANEVEFMRAMDQYKRDNRRPFPTWSEVLEVLHALGYRKVAAQTEMPGLHPENSDDTLPGT
jgi:hypothetical protein